MSALLPPRESSEAELLEAIRDVSQTVIARLMPQASAEGLIAPTFWHLHHIQRTGVRHPGELARRLGISPAMCTWAVDQLVRQGLVARRPSEEDRRQVILAVTPKGRRTLEKVWRHFDGSLRPVLGTLAPKDVATTARTLRAIHERLGAEPGPLGGRPRP